MTNYKRELQQWLEEKPERKEGISNWIILLNQLSSAKLIRHLEKKDWHSAYNPHFQIIEKWWQEREATLEEQLTQNQAKVSQLEQTIAQLQEKWNQHIEADKTLLQQEIILIKEVLND